MSNTNIGFRNIPRYRDMTPDKALHYIEAIGIGNRNIEGNMLDALIVAEKALKRVIPTKPHTRPRYIGATPVPTAEVW